MTVVFDVVSTKAGDLDVFTWAHTIAAQDSRGLLVSGTRRTAGPPAISSITYAGVALTELKTVGGALTNVAMYYLANPATGANNVVVTLAGQSEGHWSARSFYHAGGPMAVADTNGNAAAAHLAPVSRIGGLVFDALSAQNANLVQTAPQVADYIDWYWAPSIGHSHKAAAAGTTAMDWTMDSSPYYYLAVCIAPMSSGGVWFF